VASGHNNRIGVILLAMGGPDSTADVGEFLRNVFSDRAIIRLPGGPLLQKPLARLIARLRLKKVTARYEQIGGGSPLLKWTTAQKELLASRLESQPGEFRCYVGMRYFRPTIADAFAQAHNDACRRIVLLPLYPQYCRATTVSSFAEAARAAHGYDELRTIQIDDFHDDPAYIALMREYIDQNIRDSETLLFSAHSIPQSFVDDGDPYVDQVRRTAALTAGEREYFVSFQSRTGPVTWVGPDTVAEATRLLQEGRRLFVVPISFVCDHIETLHEIDIELPELMPEDLGRRIRRMPMFNDDPRLADLLAVQVTTALEGSGHHDG